MLRTNSKKACENIKAYIMDNFDVTDYAEYEEYPEAEPETWPEIAAFIWDTFDEEKPRTNNYRNVPDEIRFKDWTQGLPPVLNCLYWWYNRSAVDDVSKILEEKPEEAAKYGEIEAGELLTHLMYRELSKEIRRQRAIAG